MRLLTPQQIQDMLPATTQQKENIANFRKTVCNLIKGTDQRITLVFGPCSIHEIGSAIEYAKRFQALAKQVGTRLFCVMRVYIEKPRTTNGWKGFVYDPDLDGSGDLQMGILKSRELFLTLTDLGIPIATEILHPLLAPFFSDLISWGFIGARTSASQPHRELASSLHFPIGFKNSPDGNIQQAIQAMIAAKQPHRFPFLESQGKLMVQNSEGNPWTHIVLRGSLLGTNYDSSTLSKTDERLHMAGFKHRILIDCSHDNCQKEFARQKQCFESILDQILLGNSSILGMMLESHLQEGAQVLLDPPLNLQYGVSITDPCLGWSDTESLVQSAFEALSTSYTLSNK